MQVDILKSVILLKVSQYAEVIHFQSLAYAVRLMMPN